jgi:hypothetical protein
MTALTTPAASAALGFGDPLRTARRRVVRRALKVAQPPSKFQELILFFLPRILLFCLGGSFQQHIHLLIGCTLFQNLRACTKLDSSIVRRT